MTPEGRPDGRGSGSGRSVSDTAAAEAALKAKLSRKRTKTGCLTCRKRRIKCGEERPICKNCIKSKRHCEGYNQRVIFKPTFDYQPVPNGGAHITFQAGPVLASAPSHVDPHGNIIDPSAYSQLRPRGGSEQQQFVTVFDQRLGQYVQIPQMSPQPSQHPQHHAQSSLPPTPNGHFSPEQGHFFQHGLPPPVQQPQPMLQGAPMFQHAMAPVHVPAAHPVSTAAPMAQGSFEQYLEPALPSNGLVATPVTMPMDQVRQAYGQAIGHEQQPPGHMLIPLGQGPQHPQEWTDSKPVFNAEHAHIPAPPASSHSSSTLSLSHTPILSAQHQWTTSSYVPRPELPQAIDHQHPSNTAHAIPFQHQHQTQGSLGSLSDIKTPEYYDFEAQVSQHVTPTTMLTAAARETIDDDYWDVGSDEEMDLGMRSEEQGSQERQHALNRILALNRTNSHDLQMRRYDTFIYDGVLDHYKVEEHASPLKNPATAAVFAHFISVTGPSLSIFERHPRSSSLLFAEGSVPLSQQGLWTYTMPMAALRNQGLLHAMLAIASLQIARLQNASTTPSMQHYAWALRRIHAIVGNHKKSRLKVTTIAASLLLGFYEVMTADHMKWNMHLAGSKQLIVETDFVKMTRDFRVMKAERARRIQPPTVGRFSSEEPNSQDALLDQIPDVDENIISHITGREVRYDNHGHIEAAHMAISPNLDLHKFEILKDLYWWYCKQDVYQSIVSGNHLLLEYSRWANCPPRAPLGKIDAVYGTVDHLMLLLGRVADFATRDRKRKLRQIDANGGQWRPAPGMNIPQPPQQPEQQQPPSTPMAAPGFFPGMPMQSPGEPPNGGMPQFYGMAPPPRANVQMPASYNPSYNIPTPQSATSPVATDLNLEMALAAAIEEYGQIRAALHTFSISLGEAFGPLTSEYQTPMETAFGTARFYRSYDIGCMWAIYNMAEIIAIRSQPNMPPAAHMAAGIAALETAPYANEIGRIAAGIVPSPPDQPLNPTLGAALCESCMPSFFAAVQYQHPAQRHETVTRIFSIAKRTGWGSAELIANGVETAWVKAAAIGRGPPYRRIVRPSEYVNDPRLNGSWEHLDPNAAPAGDDEGDRRLIAMKKEARLNWAIGVMGVEDDVQKIRISD